jgi:hypothetical protein
MEIPVDFAIRPGVPKGRHPKKLLTAEIAENCKENAGRTNICWADVLCP